MKIMNGISPSCGDENRNCNKKGIVRTYYLLLPLPLFLVPLRLRCLADFLVGPGPGNTVRIDIDQTLAHYFLPASQPTKKDSSHSADAYLILGIQKEILPEQDLELENHTRRIFIKRFSLVSRVTPYL